MVLIADHGLGEEALARALAPARPADEIAARRALRGQIARLERQLADALVTAFPGGGVDVAVRARQGPRLLDLGALEALRDDLAERLRAARAALAEQAERRREAQLLLEAMHADPRRHRFVRLARSELGVPGCGAYEVRPRLGLVGMLMGWWQVKLSSGCPRTARGEPAARLVSLLHMGRRSRKRSISDSPAGEPRHTPAPATTAPRPAPATLRRRAPSSERPPAPWGAFPLGELTTLAGIVLIVVGFAGQTFRLLAVGFALVALAACELALREHLAGFRSHSSLLGLLAGFITGAALVTASASRVAVLAAAAAAFVVTFLLMRRMFQRKTGGMGFRA